MRSDKSKVVLFHGAFTPYSDRSNMGTVRTTPSFAGLLCIAFGDIEDPGG